MKKRWLPMLLSAVLATSIVAGCGNGQSAGNSSGSSPSGKADKEEQVEIRIMGYNPESTRATYLKMLEEKLPNIKVVFEFVSLDNFNNVLNSQLQAGQGPDIIEVGGETRLLASAGHLMELTDESFTSKYVQSGLTPFSVNGKVYAAPLQSWHEGIYYNKAIFRENDIKIPRTFDEFIQIHKDLSAKGIKPQTMGAQSWEPMMKQSIGLVNNEFYSNPENQDFDERFNRGEVKLAEAWLPYVEQWSRVITEGILTKDMLGLSNDQALDEFATGKAAMFESGPWDEVTIMKKNPDLELGMFPFPGLTEGPGWLVGGPGSALAINAKTAHKAEALQILELTATPEAQQALVKDNAGSSFLKGVDIDLGEVYADCEEAFKAGNVYAPWTAVWISGNPIVEGYGKSLQEVLAGMKTVKQALEDADNINDTMRKTLE
ncbi:Multiple sugar-binding protein [Paenibacillus sp. CECT 9249]|uniref:ABC transporter substrate-binding protein n=1 Tax=Paenibacillus sp. CECT 9249 TaxID=2845385 RepID=UPI001E4BAFEF|nr:extracellular solute-binding protein [Paenibacillus sp. CECT 9249]CAH0120141.1 Multiple sugar-binding protein [Paenibacillus sp. CECT 9249]